jgi:tetratricopeptide (TPR) repeat protein
MTGCYGNGKSALATAVGHEVNKKFVVPIVIDVRGCLSTEGIAERMVDTFGLYFRYKELNFFYNWINCHEQRFLFVLDNLDIPPEEDNNLSNLLDNVIRHVKDLRILCTSRRNFFKGITTHEVYRLGNAEQFSLDILKQLLPDLHEEGLELLLDVCAHNPDTIKLVSNAFTMDEVDSGKLFEELVESMDHPLLNRLEVSLYNLTHDEGELEILRRLVVCVLKVVDNIPLGHAELLQKASHFKSSFDCKSLATLADRRDISSVESSLNEMKDIGLILGGPDCRYYLTSLVKLVNQSKIDERGSDNLDYYKRTLEDIKILCAMYHSKNCKDAMNTFRDNFDNFVYVFNKVIEREDTYDFCPSFASLEYALFLGELMPEEVYINFYESLAQESEDNNDIAKQCRSLCCLSHKLAMEESASAAKHAVDRAYDLVHTNGDAVSDTERAFCLRCMGKIVWEDEEDRGRALLLVKKSLDLYKAASGARDLQTIHTNELYARMLTQKESYQTARHFYNISDLFVTEMVNEHPLLIEGYNCRRIIWDSLCLFQRATDTAKKAVEISKSFHGEHPVTARMLSSLCDAIIKRGSLNDAIRAGIDALSIRSKVLGDHLETGESYKKLAYLMLRSGQYDEASRFGQSALEIFDKVDASEMLRIDVRNVIAQARLRLEYKSHVFVELQGRDASRKNLHNDAEELKVKKAPAPISTDV